MLLCKVDANPTTRKCFYISESQEGPARNIANLKWLDNKKHVKKQGEEIQRITSGAPTQQSGFPEEPWDTNP